eukprot:1765102-Rhodomonas_salina.4
MDSARSATFRATSRPCPRFRVRVCSQASFKKPGLIDTKRREHRLWRDSCSQASAEPQKRSRTKNRQDATNGATVLGADTPCQRERRQPTHSSAQVQDSRVRGVTWGHVTAHTAGSRVRMRNKDHTLSICDRVGSSSCPTLPGGEPLRRAMIRYYPWVTVSQCPGVGCAGSLVGGLPCICLGSLQVVVLGKR